MQSMPTTFLVTPLPKRSLLEQARRWGWRHVGAVGDELLFVGPDGEVIRSLKTAWRAMNLRKGAKLLLGPNHFYCDGIQQLIKMAVAGTWETSVLRAVSIETPPPSEPLPAG